jgi:hypothetical protein
MRFDPRKSDKLKCWHETKRGTKWHGLKIVRPCQGYQLDEQKLQSLRMCHCAEQNIDLSCYHHVHSIVQDSKEVK